MSHSSLFSQTPCLLAVSPVFDINTKPPECVDYNPQYIMRFSRLVPWKHESVGRVLSGHQLGKPSDVRGIMSTHEGSFVFIIHATKNII